MYSASHPLTSAIQGRPLRIRHLSTAREVSLRLREIGFQEDGVLHCVSNSHQGVICDIAGGRFGLSRDVARNIHVSEMQ